jgi:hypothetical protein
MDLSLVYQGYIYTEKQPMGLRAFFIHFIMILLLPWVLYAEGRPTSQEENSTQAKSVVSGTEDMAKKLISYIPDSDTKRGLKAYAEALGFNSYSGFDGSVGSGNHGLGDYFAKRYSNKKKTCVREAAVSFYSDIAAYLNKRAAAPRKEYEWPQGYMQATEIVPFYDFDQSATYRAKLNESIGSGKYANYEPGWVWNLALKHANGDPNSALFLIGMCGHDDTQQGAKVASDNSERAQNEVRIMQDNTREKIKKMQMRLDGIKAKYSDKNEQEIVRDELQYNILDSKRWLESLKKSKGTIVQLECPPTSSAFYGAKSLGESADIPTELKNELIETFQGAGAKDTSSKYYHVYGSAFMACQLIQNGVSPTVASTLQQQAARVYRGIRMCEATNAKARMSKENQDIENALFEKYKTKDPIKFVAQIAKDRTLIKKCNAGEYSQECIYLQNLDFPIYTLAESEEFEIDEKSIQKKIDGRLSLNDAASLYRHWYLGGTKVAGQTLPCSDLRVLGPTNLKEPMDSFFGRISKPKEWSDERYKNASKKIATWDADFKWTIVQHKAGAEFAGKVCKKRGPNEPPLKGICPENAGVSNSNGTAPSSNPVKGTN